MDDKLVKSLKMELAKARVQIEMMQNFREEQETSGLILYGIYNPEGKLFGLEMDEVTAWISVFDMQGQEFVRQYWHKMAPAKKAAKKLGWNVVKGHFVKDSKR